MLVLMDIEWVQRENKKHDITQIAAIKVDSKWRILDTFDSLARPALMEIDWQHMAFRGYSKEDFLNAKTIDICIEVYTKWIDSTDVICFWNRESAKVLKESYKAVTGHTLLNKIICVDEIVYRYLEDHKSNIKGLYKIAEMCGIAIECMHCSVNDVKVLKEILDTLKISHNMIKNAKKHDKNRKFLQKTEYNYIFGASSEVFHKKDCHLLLNIKEINGCIKYSTAMKKRKPCKICNPTPPTAEPVKINDVPTFNHQTDGHIQLFEGTHIYASNEEIYGYCHYALHTGYIDKNLLEKHRCIRKSCKYLEKNLNNSFWKRMEQEAIKKEKKKQIKKEAQQQAKESQRKLNDMLEEFYFLSASINCDLEPIRVEQINANRYAIFYVSNNAFPDGNLYLEFLQLVNHHHPDWKISLKHIKDEKGKFVTTEQFYLRKKKK